MGEVVLAAQPPRLRVGVAPVGREQVLEPVEEDAEAEFSRAHAEPDSQVRLADPAWARDQQGVLLADPLAGRQCFDAAALERRLEREIEVAERPAGRQPLDVESQDVVHTRGRS